MSQLFSSDALNLASANYKPHYKIFGCHGPYDVWQTFHFPLKTAESGET